MKTLAFYAVFGVVPGYHHFNLTVVNKGSDVKDLVSTPKTRLQIVSEAWQEAMQKEFDESKVLVSAVLHESNTIYPVGFGCPSGGELTVTVNGRTNPNSIPDKGHAKDWNHRIGLFNYREAVIRVCDAVKESLDQTTVSIEFYEIEDFVYLSSKDTK